MEKASLKPGAEKALVALSGGPSSRYVFSRLLQIGPSGFCYVCYILHFYYRAMLQLLYEYNREEPHKKSKKQVFKSVEVCFIDESAVVGEVNAFRLCDP